MQKVAIFVEGFTELAITRWIIEALCGKSAASFEIVRQHGGRLSQIELVSVPSSPRHVMIVNCATDSQVKPKIIENYNSLARAGYKNIIGLYDVIPFSHADIVKLEASLYVGLPAGPVPIEMHLAKLEVEAWFLDEISHFPRLNSSLTIQAIVAAGFDVVNTTGAQWHRPANVLHDIYAIAGLAYKKRGRQILRTVRALDADELYLTARARSPSLNGYIASLEASLF